MRRKELVKLVKVEAENSKISIRNARKDANSEIKKTSSSEDLQKNAFNDFPFTAENMVEKANKVRQDFLSRFTNTQL